MNPRIFEFTFFITHMPKWHDALELAVEILAVIGIEPTETERYGNDFKSTNWKLKTAMKRTPDFDTGVGEYFLGVHSVWPNQNGKIDHSILHSNVSFSPTEDNKARVYMLSVSVDPRLVDGNDIETVSKKVCTVILGRLKDTAIGFGMYIDWNTPLEGYFYGSGMKPLYNASKIQKKRDDALHTEINNYYLSKHCLRDLIDDAVFRNVYWLNLLNSKQVTVLQNIFEVHNNSQIIGSLEILTSGHGFWSVPSHDRETAFGLLKEHATVQYEHFHSLEGLY